MKKIKNLNTILFLCLFSFATFAGTGGRTVGNGGDVLKCEANGSFTYTILDWYEGIEIRNLNLNLGESHLGFDEKIQIALNRLQRVSPKRAARFQLILANFFNETKWLTSGTLIDVPDSDHILLPNNCQILQIANQSTPVLSTDKRYVIDFKLWQELNDDQKVALVLHEIIYKEALEDGHRNSISTRILNSLVLSKELEAMSVNEFTNVLKILGFKTAEVQGIEVSLESDFLFYQNGNLKKANVIDGSLVEIKNNRVALKGEVQFFETGAIEKLTPAGPMKFVLNEDSFNVLPFPIWFFENGKIRSLILNRDNEVKRDYETLKIEGATSFFETGKIQKTFVKAAFAYLPFPLDLRVAIMGNTSFYSNGNLEQTELINDLSIQVANKKSVKINGTTLFHSNGHVLKSFLKESTELSLQGKKVLVSMYHPLTFWEGTNQLKSFKLASPAVLKNQRGISHKIAVDELVRLDLNEYLVSL